MSNDKPAYGQHSASQSILELAREHPYEYVEQLRALQGATCSCCPMSDAEADALLRTVREMGAVALQKGLDYLALALNHLVSETCMCPSCFLNRAYTRAT